MSSFNIFSSQDSSANTDNYSDEKRCAQEILDSLVDKRTSLEKIHEDCNTSSYSYGRSSNSSNSGRLAYTRLASSENTAEIIDSLEMFFKALDEETKDRMALAKAKVIAKATVGDVEMTVSEMENRRKLIPKYMSFLKKYIHTIGVAERELSRKLAEVKSEGESMAREALSSLGSAKGASDAATFVKSIQSGHNRDNQYSLVTQHVKSKERAELMLEKLENMIGDIDSAKINANAVAMEPFIYVGSLSLRSQPEAPHKTVQDILCASTEGPASLFAKMNKLTEGLTVASDSGNAGQFVVAGIKGPGMPKVELYSKDILQRYNDWFEQLIRYKTAMDKLNLEVTMKSGDGRVVTMQEELIREDQSDIVGKFLGVCAYQLSSAKSDLTTTNQNVETEIQDRVKALELKHRNEISRNSKAPVEVSEDDATSVARAALQKAQHENLLAAHKAEVDELNRKNEKYRLENIVEIISVPDFESRLTKLRSEFDENKKVNRRRRAPANARFWVNCNDL